MACSVLSADPSTGRARSSVSSACKVARLSIRASSVSEGPVFSGGGGAGASTGIGARSPKPEPVVWNSSGAAVGIGTGAAGCRASQASPPTTAIPPIPRRAVIGDGRGSPAFFPVVPSRAASRAARSSVSWLMRQAQSYLECTPPLRRGAAPIDGSHPRHGSRHRLARCC